MSTIINLAVPAYHYEGPQQIYSVDTHLTVSAECNLAKARNHMAEVRRCVYLVHEDGHGRAHADSPRTVGEVTTVFVNPDWIISIEEGRYHEATARWRTDAHKRHADPQDA